MILGGMKFVSTVFFFLIAVLTGVFTSRRGSRLVGRSGTVVVTPDIAIGDAPGRDKASLFVLRRNEGMVVGSGAVGR